MSDATDLFPGFDSRWVDGEEGKLFARFGGNGPALLLLHGFPETHVCWHRIAPKLAEHFTVVCMDMRGYGWSTSPRSEEGKLYSKRAMGRDAIRVMEDLGHARFALAGHDRGARVGYRLALDHPGRLSALALLDILPTYFMWQEIRAGRMAGAHWEFLAQPAPEPENEIKKNPLAYFEGLMASWSGDGLKVFDPRALKSYRDQCNDPYHIHAFCEDYRAGATIDLDDDDSDLAAKKTIDCPTLVLWSSLYLGARASKPLDAWHQSFAPQAKGAVVKGGHFLAEEDSAGVLAALLPFLAKA